MTVMDDLSQPAVVVPGWVEPAPQPENRQIVPAARTKKRIRALRYVNILGDIEVDVREVES
jgi:hypothetical protein